MSPVVQDLRTTRVVAEVFRGAMRQLATGVSVLTTGRDENITGITVTSLSSLSVDPPTLIVSIDRASLFWPRLQRYHAFGVNILSASQLEIADRFAGTGSSEGPGRFSGVEWTSGVSGVPLLTDALAAVDCEVEELIERHSHAIVIGRVLEIRTSARRKGALAYWQRQYVAIDQDEDAVKLAEVSLPTSRGFWSI
ncbi:MAG: flavin reductase family protein [Afipia sp.]